MDIGIKEKLKSCLEEKMEEEGLYFLEDSELFIDSLYIMFCRDCEIEGCNVCRSVREEMELYIIDKSGSEG
ncbi:hypothetical protein AMET1_1039 [Methanonatronarchaeum thermophilum]|uniref:Uncharacterized protein n=1 Tax=Methanonatronarchaeum thermophilum TaxID=1927129 RepID=A0A1Y3GA43_9EURY|nr:hypothetical protein [Methanonatronarchaeum thermophilum]OUJ18137.1 hypothetical protein AMET1_1039 [Methanonatronarchaeum thermophilum]